MDSKYEIVARACIASVDVVLDCEMGGFSLQNKGNFFYFVAIANSIMDNSTKTMEDGVVDSLSNRNAQPLKVSSSSPLKAKSTT